MCTVLTPEELIDECFNILDKIYDNILEINCVDMTMKCVKWSGKTPHYMPVNVGMLVKDALDFFVNDIVAEEDREKMHEFFRKGSEKTLSEYDIEFRINKEHGLTQLCKGKLIFSRYRCWFCFDSVKKIQSSLDVASESCVENPYLPEVRVQTFGFFDVFVNGKAILFRSKKAKELLALLVDRRGGYVSSNEAISCLWEDDPVDEKTLSRYRKVAMRLNETLKENGIENIVENIGGKRRIVAENLSCDLYDYLSDRDKNGMLFNGNYMLNYSWGEITLAGL